MQDISANRINVESLLEQSQHKQFFYSSCMGIKRNIIVGIFLLHPHIFRKHKTPIPSATPRYQKSISNPAAFDVASTRRLSLIPTPKLLKNSNMSVVTHFVFERQRRRGIFASKQHWELKKNLPYLNAKQPRATEKRLLETVRIFQFLSGRSSDAVLRLPCHVYSWRWAIINWVG